MTDHGSIWAGVAADLEKERDALNARVAELEAERLRLAKYVARAHSVHGSRVYDYACAECIPHGEILIPGFRCTVHLALSIVAGETTPSGGNAHD